MERLLQGSSEKPQFSLMLQGAWFLLRVGSPTEGSFRSVSSFLEFMGWGSPGAKQSREVHAQMGKGPSQALARGWAPELQLETPFGG